MCSPRYRTLFQRQLSRTTGATWRLGNLEVLYGIGDAAQEDGHLGGAVYDDGEEGVVSEELHVLGEGHQAQGIHQHGCNRSGGVG